MFLSDFPKSLESKTHTAHIVFPTIEDTVPCSQSAHAGAPLMSAKRPLGQSKHCEDPEFEDCPGMHISHSVDASVLMNRPAEHAAQADEPDELLYCPTKQSEQTSTDVAPTTELEVPGKH
jgi:hypothetical protein